jgi:O-antigen ligase
MMAQPIPRAVSQERTKNFLERATVFLLQTMIFLIPWEPLITIPSFGSAVRAVGILAFLVGILSLLSLGRLQKPSPMFFCMILFVAWVMASLLWTIDAELTLQRCFSYIQLLFFVWLIENNFVNYRDLTRTLEVYVLGSYLACGLTFLFFILAGGSSMGGRYGVGDTNWSANLVAISIPISLHLSLTKIPLRLPRKIYLFFTPIGLFMILLSGSRGGIVVAVVGLSYLLWGTKALTIFWKFIIVAVSAICIFSTIQFIPEYNLDRILGIQEELTTGTMSLRRQIWNQALIVYPEHPLSGTGFGTFPAAIGMVKGYYDISAHNSFISILVEGGIIGLGLFLLIPFVGLMSVFRIPSPDRNLWFVLLSVWGVMNLPLNLEWQKITWLIFALLACYARYYREHSRVSVRQSRRTFSMIPQKNWYPKEMGREN